MLAKMHHLNPENVKLVLEYDWIAKLPLEKKIKKIKNKKNNN